MAMDLCSIFKPMNVVKRADRKIQYAKVLFKGHQSAMRNDDRILAKDQILCAKEFRLGVEEKSWIAKVKQAKLYSKRAQMVLDTVEDAVEKTSELVGVGRGLHDYGAIVGA